MLRPLTRTLNATEATALTWPDSGRGYPERIESSRDSDHRSKHPHNPLKHIIEKVEKKMFKRKLTDFGVTAFPIPLQWIQAVRNGEVYAEILCSAELIQVK